MKYFFLFLAIYFFYKYVTKPTYIVPKNQTPPKTNKKPDYTDYEEIK